MSDKNKDKLNLFTKLRQLIRHLKWGRPEARLCILASLSLAAALWLFNADAFNDSIVQTWVAPALLAVAGLLVSIAFVKVWRFSTPPLDTIDEIQGPVLRGASAFTPQDGEIFKKLGRQGELQKLKDWIQDDQVPLVIVMGESGVGKTSLLRAGVQNLVSDDEVAYWEAVATDSGEKLRRAVRARFGKNPNSVEKGVLLVDQAEQLGTDREVFELLQKHLEADPPYRVTWILAMRREYHYSWVVWSLKHLDETVRHRVRELPVEHFNRDRAKEIFSTLAAEADLTVQEAVRDRIVQSIAEADKVSPVDLAIALQVLGHNPKHAEDPRFFVSIGGHSAMLTSYLERELQRYTEPEREAVYRALLVLIEEEGEEDRRKADGVSVDELHQVARPKTPEMLNHALHRLTLPGVRVLERCAETKDRLRLVHERFIPAVRRLAGAVLTKSEQASRLLARRCAAWLKEEKEQRFLLSGKELRQVERELPRLRWGEDREGKERFLQRSRQKRRMARAAGTVSAAMAIVALALLSQWQQVREAKNQLDSWGLHPSLYEVLPQVSELSVQSAPVSTLTWLGRARELERLEFVDLPALVQITRYQRLQVHNLRGLPEQLQQLNLNLRGKRAINLEGLPKQLQQLNLNLSESQVSSLKGLPERLQQLNLDLSKSQVSSLEELPEQLQELDLNLSYSQVNSLKGLPEQLQQLNLNLSYSKVRSLEGLPEQLQQLNLDLSYSQVNSLKGLPEQLRQLNLDLSGTQVNSLEGLPEQLQQLTINLRSSQVSSLAGLPEWLQQLTLDLRLHSLQVGSLEGLPEQLQQLNLILSYSQINRLEGLPEQLQQLNLDLSHSQINRLEGLPEKLQQLNLDLSSSQVSSLNGLPKQLQQLNLDLGYSQVSSLNGLPEQLQQLTLDLSRTQVKSLEGLPQQLQQLNLNLSSSMVKSLGGLPQQLQQLYLNLSETQVSSLAGLPKQLQQLNLNLSETQVSSLAGLPEQLQQLYLNLSRTQVSSLAGLPKQLQQLNLNLSETQVSSLAGLPKQLQQLALNLSETQVSSLKGIPGQLQQLNINLGTSQVSSLEGLPQQLQQLSLDLGYSQVSNLKGLSERLQEVTLDIRGVRVDLYHLPPNATLHLTL